MLVFAQHCSSILPLLLVSNKFKYSCWLMSCRGCHITFACFCFLQILSLSSLTCLSLSVSRCQFFLTAFFSFWSLICLSLLVSSDCFLFSYSLALLSLACCIVLYKLYFDRVAHSANGWYP